MAQAQKRKPSYSMGTVPVELAAIALVLVFVWRR